MSQSEPKLNQTGSKSGPVADTVARVDANPTSLQPKQPPGLRSRKVRRFGDRIRELHAEGYSLETIRETLAEAGVIVSKSTVQREAARRPTPSAPTTTDGSALSQPLRPSPTVSRELQNGSRTPRAEVEPTAHVHQSGKDIAEAFFDTHSSNPLLRKDKR